MKYLYSVDEAKTIHKHGVAITLFNTAVKTGNFVYEECATGHLEEFYDDKSTYMWYVIDGDVTFIFNDEQIVAATGDVVIAPPKTRIHYFGKVKMLLCTTPAFDPQNEHHVREVDPSESPYK